MAEVGLTIRKVMIRTGKSEKWVRNKIKDGTLKADLVDGDHGKEYRVWVEDDGTESPDFAHLPTLPTSPPLAKQLADAIAGGVAPMSADVQALTAAVLALNETLNRKPEKRGLLSRLGL